MGSSIIMISRYNNVIYGYNEIMLPPDEPLPLRELNVPYLLVADAAFAFTPRIMNPYSGVYEKGSKES